MAKYHVNGSGMAGVCSAQNGNCPFGGEAEHYATSYEARRAYEVSQGAQAAAPVTKSKGKPLLDYEAFERTVKGLALRATAHNNGEAVYRVEPARDGDGAVRVKLSSPPRATEAKRELEAAGFAVSFQENENGQWIRAVQPDPAVTIESSMMTWSKDSNKFLVEISDLQGTIPRFIKGKDGVTAEVFTASIHTKENETLYWELAPRDRDHNWTITLFND